MNKADIGVIEDHPRCFFFLVKYAVIEEYPLLLLFCQICSWEWHAQTLSLRFLFLSFHLLVVLFQVQISETEQDVELHLPVGTQPSRPPPELLLPFPLAPHLRCRHTFLRGAPHRRQGPHMGQCHTGGQTQSQEGNRHPTCLGCEPSFDLGSGFYELRSELMGCLHSK